MEPTVITLVPHTHWDREWYEPFSVFSDRLVAMMDALIELADGGFPHFHLDGQTAMIDDYLERRPERLDDIRRLAASGQISVGPWVTQMDEFLTGGESHIRNLEMGRARARELAGERALDVGYMPDQFGHIGQMPQILRLGGLDRAMVWRGVPRSIDRSSFRWSSPDGSEVLTEYMVFGYFFGGSFFRAHEPGEVAAAITESVATMRPFLVDRRMIVMVGYDHAGPDGTLPERIEAAEAMAPDLEVTIADVASHVHAQSTSDDLPVWRGELRSSARAHLLPNVYSARVHQKRERGRVEALIERYAEPLAAQVPGFTWPEHELSRVWTLLLHNGAHDSACGCSHDQVAIDVDARFAEARRIGTDIVERALGSLGSMVQGGGAIRFNPSPFPREGVPGNGWAVVPAGHEPDLVEVSIEPLPDGSGVSADGVPIRCFDEPDVGDLYTFCYEHEGQAPEPAETTAIEGHEITWTWPGLRLVMRIVRRTGERFLRLDGVIHNERPDHRLRLHVGLASQAAGSLAGSPFELVERPLVGEGSPVESASPTWPARGVVMAGRRAILHEGVFEYEVTQDVLAVTLLRCVGTISRKELATRPFEAGPGTLTPDAQMIGETAITLGLVPEASRDGLLEDHERFALELAEAVAGGGGDMADAGSFHAIGGSGQLSSIRRRRTALEVRLWNPWSDRMIDVALDGAARTLGPAEIATIELV
jgi:alpha-mannosidase